MKKPTPKTARQIRGSAAIEVAYRKKLTAIVDEIHASVLYWITARYKENEARIVGDASPADSLQRELKKLMRQWGKRLDGVPEKVAEWFSKQNKGYTTRALMDALKAAGFTVTLRTTQRIRDSMKAAMHENVSLIKSIPAQYLEKVEGIVNRGVMAGRDLGSIVEGIEDLHQVTTIRAKMIARDQNNKATNAMTKARYEDLGIEKAVWQHNAGGRTFRETHVEMDGKVFELAKGMWDRDALGKKGGAFVQPGECVNCRCSYRPYLPEFGSVGKDEEAQKKAGEQTA